MLRTAGLAVTGVVATAAFTAASAQPAPGRPSFSCAAARTYAERTICAEGSELPRLDRIVAELFAQGRSLTLNPSQSAEFDRAQRTWLSERNACRDRQCLRNAYFRRIADLVQALPDGS